MNATKILTLKTKLAETFIVSLPLVSIVSYFSIRISFRNVAETTFAPLQSLRKTTNLIKPIYAEMLKFVVICKAQNLTDSVKNIEDWINFNLFQLTIATELANKTMKTTLNSINKIY